MSRQQAVQRQRQLDGRRLQLGRVASAVGQRHRRTRRQHRLPAQHPRRLPGIWTFGAVVVALIVA